jgi:hypothetical protein
MELSKKESELVKLALQCLLALIDRRIESGFSIYYQRMSRAEELLERIDAEYYDDENP